MPRLPRFNAPVPSVGRRATPGDFGADAATASASVAEPISRLGEIGAQIEIARANAQSARVSAEYGIALEDAFQQRLDSGDPPEAWEQGFTQDANRIREQSLGGLVGGAKGRFESEAAVEQARALSRLRNAVRDRQVALGRGDLNTGIAAKARLAAAGDPYAREDALKFIGQGLGSNLITAAEASDMQVALDDQIAESAALRLKNENPALGVEMLKERSGPFAHMAEDSRQRAIAALETEVEQRERFARAREAEQRAAQREARVDLENNTRKDLLLMAARGELTVDQIEQQRDNLSASAVSELLTDVRQADAAARTGTPDPEEYYRLRSLQAVNPGSFSGERIDPKRVGFENAAKLIEDQQKIRKGAGEAPGGMRDRLKRWTDGLNIGDSGKAELYRDGEEAIFRFQEQNGRPATDSEQAKILDDVYLNQVRSTRPWWWFNSTDVIPPGQSIDPERIPPIPGVPDSEVTKIAEALASSNRRITVDNIRRAYAASQARKARK